jgi:trehalose synthase
MIGDHHVVPSFLRRERLQKVATTPLDLTPYREIIPSKLYDEIIELAKPLKGVQIAMLNATAYGGGVAEIFKSMVPLMQSIGVEAHWYVMPADDEFFGVTKGFHNALQGADYEMTDEAKQIYLRHNQRTAELMKGIHADIFEIHDPQPAAVGEYLPMEHTIWRCHIDTSTPNQEVWEFLRPFIERYNELIFTMPEYVHGDLVLDSLNFITPTIDPLTVKNRPLGLEFAKAMMEAFKIDTNKPLVCQVSRFDPWKDPKGVIDAYRIAKKKIPELQLALVGSMANDDPEGQEIYRDVEAYTRRDKDIHLLTNLTGVGELEVNAFQAYSDVIIQKSIREGFGLTVTEGMWKGKPVIGGNVGGIKIQIKDGENGYLVDTDEECAERMLQLLKQPKTREEMGKRAKKTATENFLHPRLIRDHLRLYHKLLKI